uniref:Uncharacterized protein n=1 Tax=Populus alba TaxID=43335 RepID=A0A4U5PYF3_POPAL|nr:hypothetical protein D5086_0000160440 [Populus alba]
MSLNSGFFLIPVPGPVLKAGSSSYTPVTPIPLASTSVDPTSQSFGEGTPAVTPTSAFKSSDFPQSLISEDLTSEGSKSQSEASAGVAPESIQGTPKHVILTARGRRPSSRQQGGRNQPVHNNRTSSYRLNFESQSQEFEELFWFKH